MSFREQKKFLEELKRYEWKMEEKDKADYKLFIKRDKDEDEFDSVSMKRLKSLHEKYYTTKSKLDIEQFFKKTQ
ncbi:MAG: hypothetical protein C0425_06220 [Chlorobiaceae bacterium]|nr:hypothetical protein [Chlorobiaceae bacterium]MBA4309915.1 hypothetical protein [Chlorobiaceae bacterium]